MDCFDAFKKLGVPEAFVTSVPSSQHDSIKNLFINKSSSIVAEHKKFDYVPHGSGDLLAALTLSRILDGITGEKLVQTVNDSVYKIICTSLYNQADELAIVNGQEDLVLARS